MLQRCEINHPKMVSETPCQWIAVSAQLWVKPRLEQPRQMDRARDRPSSRTFRLSCSVDVSTLDTPTLPDDNAMQCKNGTQTVYPFISCLIGGEHGAMTER